MLHFALKPPVVKNALAGPTTGLENPPKERGTLREQREPTASLANGQEVQQLGGECTYPAIKAKIRSTYGDDVNDSSMTCSIISGAVNHPSRIPTQREQEATDRGYRLRLPLQHRPREVVWYEPEKHGVWEIAKAGDGDLIVRLADGVGENPTSVAEAVEATADAYGMFALEAHLRDYLAKTSQCCRRTTRRSRCTARTIVTAWSFRQTSARSISSPPATATSTCSS